MELHGKIAVVTGAGGGGQGRALSIELARRGVSVVAADSDAAGARATVERIHAETSSTAVAIAADMAIDADVERTIGAAVERFGGLDILVNNAGPFYATEGLRHWRNSIAANFTGAFYATMLAVEPMRARGGGTILYYGSTSALGYGRKHSSDPAYDASKAAVTRLATTLAWMHGAYNIRTNCIVPDWVETDEVRVFWESLTEPERLALGAPSRLTPLHEMSDLAIRVLCADALNGRVIVCWSDGEPRVIGLNDAGYDVLERLM